MASDASTLNPTVAASDRAADPPSDRAIYFLWALFWTLMIVVAFQDAVLYGRARWWEPLLWEGSSALGATFWLWLQRRARSRYDPYLDRPLAWFGHHFKWLPLVAATFMVAVYGLRHAVYASLGLRYVHEAWPSVLAYESIKLALFAGLWLGILFAFGSFAQWRDERRRLALVQQSLTEAHLQQLKAQLKPHFLFNALNTISSLMHVDADRADRLLTRLSDLLRAALQAGERDRAALSEEVRVLQLYADIMQERFGERVRIDLQIDSRANDASIPTLLLQPLLENAFKHGVERSRERVDIQIRAERMDPWLILEVRNTGALGHGSENPGIGLRNSRERLRVMYGDAASLTLTQEDGDVAARVRLPFQEHVRDPNLDRGR